MHKVLRYSEQILQGLVELHTSRSMGASIILVDLKPHNLLLDVQQDELFIADFGLSRVVNDSLSHYRTATIQGTPNYM